MIYIPILNPIVFAPAAELSPIDARPYDGLVQRFQGGDVAEVQFYADEESRGDSHRLWKVYPDGRVSVLFLEGMPLLAYPVAAPDGTVYYYFSLRFQLPEGEVFRLRLTSDQRPDIAAESAWINTCTGLDGHVRLTFRDGRRQFLDTLLLERPASYEFTPYIYVPGGFFTSGYTPGIESEGFADQRWVYRYTYAYPTFRRELTIGGARGIDNRLMSFINAAACLQGMYVDGERYTRYEDAEWKALGEKNLPRRSWSIVLQRANGEASLRVGPSADGALVDALGRYIKDNTGRYIKTGA